MQNLKNPAVKINISTGKICQDCETSRCLKDTERLKDIHEVLPVLTVVRAVRVDFVVVVLFGGKLANVRRTPKGVEQMLTLKCSGSVLAPAQEGDYVYS